MCSISTSYTDSVIELLINPGSYVDVHLVLTLCEEVKVFQVLPSGAEFQIPREYIITYTKPVAKV